jgi:hypothetical protein
MVFSRTTLLEGFKHSSSLLWREDGKTPYREYFLDEKFLPKDAAHMEGNWEVTISFIPAKAPKRVKSICWFEPVVHNTYTGCGLFVGPNAPPEPWIETSSQKVDVTCKKCLDVLGIK